MSIVGVLAFQGDFAEHVAVLASLRVPSIEVRSAQDLAKVDALIIPGGESTVIGKFLAESGVGGEIVKRVREGKGGKGGKVGKVGKGGKVGMVGKEGGVRPLFVYGTCAGAILLAKKVTGKNAMRPLGLIDIDVDRNAYGTQIDSFEARVQIKRMTKSIDAAFIRAPKITRVGKSMEILASYKGDPVLVRQRMVMAGTFHSEVRGETEVHEMFLKMIRGE
jgi:5'-phosphate synthase pdxT subunit